MINNVSENFHLHYPSADVRPTPSTPTSPAADENAFKDEYLTCLKSFDGGCSNSGALNIMTNTGDPLSLTDCYLLCRDTAECEGFLFQHSNINQPPFPYFCRLLKAGCLPDTTYRPQTQRYFS